MASCETARFLASILSPVTDRIAILCTSPYSTASEPSIISSLAQIKTHKLKTALDAIESSQEKPTTAAWETVIEDAKEMLLQSTLPDPDTEPRLDTFGHIFIFTANTHEIPAGSLIHDKLQFHIIRPAILARSDLRSLDCNGWKLGSSSESEPQAVSARKDTDPISLFNRLRALVAHSRSGKILGNMSGLRLDIKPGPGCSVEGVMGETYYPALYPGELLTILVKLRIRTTASQGYLLPNAPSQSITSPHSADIMGELDKMLGISGTSILSVKVRYEHSLLPAGTTCAVISECRLKRGLPDSDQKPSPQKPMSLRTKAFKSLVQQRLAYYLATHGTPKDALSNLRHEFGEKYHRSICPQYINLITRELKYQDRIAERLTIDASPKKRVRSPSPRPNDAFEPFVQGLFGPEIHKSQNLTANVADDEEGYSSIAPRPSLVASLRTSRTELRTDEARKIWGDMRRVSRPPNQVLNGRSVSSTVEANRRNNIRELAMRNKRSIGTDTLRSITSAGESMGKGLGAPWM